MKNSPAVSAVIPTRNRPHTICRAVNSVLGQTFQDLEVVVVLDGPDDATLDVLKSVTDSRLRVVVRPQSGGGATARNEGVQQARGEWIAFLDDDDEWLADKLARQLEKAAQKESGEPIVSSRFIARTAMGDHVWPGEMLRPGQPVSEYLLSREGIRRSDGFIITTTILARRSLLLRVPFTSGLKRHQDWDWVLRATSQPGVEVLFCPEPLAICHMQDDNSVSRSTDWQFSWNWAREMKPFLTPRAYAAFLTCHVAWQAAAQRAWGGFFPLLLDARRNGPVRISDLLRYAGFWFVPRQLRRRLAARTN